MVLSSTWSLSRPVLWRILTWCAGLSRIVKKSEHPFSPAITSLPCPALRLVFHDVIVHTHLQCKNIANMKMEMGWKKLLAYITGSVDHALLLPSAYLVTENRIQHKYI